MNDHSMWLGSRDVDGWSGQLVPAGAAKVSVLDHGFTVGDGVFETIKVEDGVPFALTRHIERLTRSAQGLGIGVPDADLLRRACLETATAAAIPGISRLRLTVTSGPGPAGSDRDEASGTVAAFNVPSASWPASTAVITVPWPRNERSAIAGLKTTSYAENALALERAHNADAGEALCADTQGRLCEGTGSNVFVVVDGQVYTPDLASGALAGITRALVIEWSTEFPVKVEDLPMDILTRADEVFLTSSTRDVMAVNRVDDRELVAPGPITSAIAEIFAARAAADIDP